LAATAIVQTGDEMRDVEFTDVKLDGDMVSFVELRQVHPLRGKRAQLNDSR
jgi:hypothetical protein